MNSFYGKYLKRVLDFILSLMAIVLLLPLLIALTIIGAFSMKGNPFFTQERPGKINKITGKEEIFKLIKFRSMSCIKDEHGLLLPDEQRLNGYGKFLRKTSLDELPELINIFVGNMSIVGPRPLMCRYLDYYTESEHHRHDVRPGLTGLAQINGRNNLSWDARFKYDLEYVKNISFINDVKIVFKTILIVLKHEGTGNKDLINLDDYRKEYVDIGNGK